MTAFEKSLEILYKSRTNVKLIYPYTKPVFFHTGFVNVRLDFGTK